MSILEPSPFTFDDDLAKVGESKVDNSKPFSQTFDDAQNPFTFRDDDDKRTLLLSTPQTPLDQNSPTYNSAISLKRKANNFHDHGHRRRSLSPFVTTSKEKTYSPFTSSEPLQTSTPSPSTTAKTASGTIFIIHKKV